MPSRPQIRRRRRPTAAEAHDLGLAHDLAAMDRRRALTLLGGAGLAAGAAVIGGCASGADVRESGATAAAGATASSTSTTAAGRQRGGPGGAPPGGPGPSGATVAEGSIPEETAGPFPGDGSNGPDVLAEDGVVRRDIRSSFGSSTTTAAGVPLTVRLRVVSVADGSAPLAGAAVYLWHCDADGGYSLYSAGIADENYLRGVQAADADGALSFQTVYPGAYSGRWPHMHFEVYPDLAAATGDGRKLRTSQLALPEDACDEVYATSGYEQSVANMRRTSLERDGVFSDGYSLQLATVEGSATGGMTASLTVPV